MKPSCRNNTDGSRVADGPVQTRSDLKDTNPSAASFTPSCQTLDASVNVPPGNLPENLLMVHEALRMDLPLHLVLRAVQNRIRTHGCTYLSLKDLVADLFDPTGFPQTEEVPMETDQLEEALMMSSPVVKRALRMGAPPHLIKPLLRAKILSNGTGYTNTYQLVADVNKK